MSLVNDFQSSLEDLAHERQNVEKFHALSFARLDLGLSDQAAAYSGVVTWGKALEAEY
jgi:hypothetical protein